MGKKIDALLGRTFKASKFKPAVSLAITRISMLKNQRRARMSVAHSDVIELLKLGQHERALIRVEQVIKEQNMLDVFAMIEGYCHFLVERLSLVEKEKGCPEELEEAVSSLIYASTRCGEFPELQEMRAMFTSRFGKEFTARAIELRNCRVNTKVVVKLSTRQPNRESRLKVLKEIASENGISLRNVEEFSITKEKNFSAESKRNQSKLDQPIKSGAKLEDIDKEKVEGFSSSIKGRKKYKDVADVAQAAYESAADAAAVELSRSESHDPDDHNSPSSQSKKVSNSNTPDPRPPNGQGLDREGSEIFKTCHSVYEYGEMQMENNDGRSRQKKYAKEIKKSLSGSGQSTSDNILQGTAVSTNTEVQTTAFEREVVFDGSDDEDSTEQSASSLTRIHDLEYEMNHGLRTKTASNNNFKTVNDDYTLNGSDSEHAAVYKHYPLMSQPALESKREPANPTTNYAERYKAERSLQLNLENRPMSVRTR